MHKIPLLFFTEKISRFQRQFRIISKMVAYAQERDLNSLFVKLPHEDEATMFENDLKGLNYQYVFEFWRKNSLLLKFQTLTFFWQFYNFLSLIKKGFPLMFQPQA